MDSMLSTRVNFFISLFITLLGSNIYAQKNNFPEYIIHAHEITGQLEKELANEFNLASSSSGGSMPHDVEEITIGFHAYRKATIDAAREMLVKATERLVKMTNSHQNIRPYLREYPIRANRAGITISFRQKNGKHETENSISFVFQVKNTIFYCVYDQASGLLETVKEEPYEEALKIVQGSK